MLLRRYIGQRLADYYSQPSQNVVGSRSLESVPFSSLVGEWHWRRVYQRLYNKQKGQWLTPVELFRPYYSRIIANFVSATRGKEETHIVELGSGRGTNANIMLSHLQQSNPQLYDRISYTIVDSSPSLHELQKQTVGEGEHHDKVNFVLKDLADIAENKVPFLEKSNVPTIAVGLELLDNLPHDKVRRCRDTRKLEQAELHGANNIPGSVDHPTLEEVFVPMTDELLSNVLERVPLYSGGRRPTWVPSVACGMLEQLIRDRPKAQLLLADFDWLPPPDVSSLLRRSVLADGEPLITAMDDSDYECYLACPPLCDILFPTNFERLALFVQRVWGDNANVQIMKQADFLQLYGGSEVDATKSWLTGFSPLIHDFGNCSVLSVTNKDPL